MHFAVGIDLGVRSWAVNGSALLGFTAGHTPRWKSAAVDVVRWPQEPISAEAMARTLHDFMRKTGAGALALDGSQGWRDPFAAPGRAGVGRWCEYETKTPGRTGVVGKVYPGSYLRWVQFCVDVFDHLLESGRAVLANDPSASRSKRLPEWSYWLLETFPTATWRTSGLASLPGHRAAPPAVVASWAKRLRARYELPASALTREHDHLQALVAALAAAGILGGPCVATASGFPARVATTVGGDTYRVEGLIWTARPEPVHRNFDAASEHSNVTSRGSICAENCVSSSGG